MAVAMPSTSPSIIIRPLRVWPIPVRLPKITVWGMHPSASSQQPPPVFTTAGIDLLLSAAIDINTASVKEDDATTTVPEKDMAEEQMNLASSASMPVFDDEKLDLPPPPTWQEAEAFLASHSLSSSSSSAPLFDDWSNTPTTFEEASFWSEPLFGSEYNIDPPGHVHPLALLPPSWDESLDDLPLPTLVASKKRKRVAVSYEAEAKRSPKRRYGLDQDDEWKQSSSTSTSPSTYHTRRQQYHHAAYVDLVKSKTDSNAIEAIFSNVPNDFVPDWTQLFGGQTVAENFTNFVQVNSHVWHFTLSAKGMVAYLKSRTSALVSLGHRLYF